MGKAHKAPASSYRRTFWVTDHARSRLRTRLTKIEGENHNGTEHRSDDDLNNLIDSLVTQAIEAGDWEEIIDNGSPAQLIDIRHQSNRRDLWAIVKTNTNTRSRGEYPQAVVTLLYTRMVQDSKRSGKWDIPSYDDGDVPIGGLSDAAKEALLSVTPTQGEEMSDETQGATGSILILYRNKKGEQQLSEWSDKTSAEKALNELRKDQRVDKSSIRVFREVATEARIVL